MCNGCGVLGVRTEWWSGGGLVVVVVVMCHRIYLITDENVNVKRKYTSVEQECDGGGGCVRDEGM